jgi:hypothetical protein
LLYLPPNTTSKIQPCDAGIIRTFKAYYRRRFNNQLLSRIESSVADLEKINLLDDIQNAIAAWKQDVQSTTIKNYFQHCQLRSDATATHEIEPPVELVAELEKQIRQFHYRNPMEIRNLLFSTILTKRQLLACPLTMTLQRLSSSNSSHRRCPRTMTMTTTAKSFRWSHRGRHQRCFPSSSSFGHSKRTTILLLLTRL